jgi:hypothetical protein
VIPFRYHIVTIVAVFLAIAVGLLAGSAFVDPALTRQLQDQTDRLRSELTDVKASNSALEAFADAALPHLTHDQLVGRSVVVITQEGVGSDVVGQATQALQGSGANVVAVLTARSSLVPTDADTQVRLAEILGQPGTAAADLPALAAQGLAERLSTAVGDAPPEDDLLSRLLSAGFLDSDVSESTLQDIGVPGQIVVVLGGGPGETPAPTAEAFAVPLVQQLSVDGVPVAAGESAATPADASFVSAVRSGGDDGTVTVDDLDLSMGAAALVLGIDDLLSTGTGGAYGVKDGAEPLPPPP